MGDKEFAFVKEALDTNWIAPVGPHVDLFEKEFCALTGAKYAAALSAGTAAIHLAKCKKVSMKLFAHTLLSLQVLIQLYIRKQSFSQHRQGILPLIINIHILDTTIASAMC